jgi:hypothetical protein
MAIDRSFTWEQVRAMPEDGFVPGTVPWFGCPRRGGGTVRSGTGSFPRLSRGSVVHDPVAGQYAR